MGCSNCEYLCQRDILFMLKIFPITLHPSSKFKTSMQNKNGPFFKRSVVELYATWISLLSVRFCWMQARRTQTFNLTSNRWCRCAGMLCCHQTSGCLTAVDVLEYFDIEKHEALVMRAYCRKKWLDNGRLPSPSVCTVRLRSTQCIFWKLKLRFKCSHIGILALTTVCALFMEVSNKNSVWLPFCQK